MILNRYFIKISLLVVIISSIYCEDCSNFNGENGCNGQQTQYPNDWYNRKWQTPPRNHPLWKTSYQDMSLITGYIQLQYNKDRSSVEITFFTDVNKEKLPSIYSLNYFFGDTSSNNNKITISKNDSVKYPNGMPVKVEIKDSNSGLIGSLELEEVHFIWANNNINLPSNYQNGQKGAIIELFGWPYEDIEKECDFISKAGYLGVKVFPPQESILSYTTVENGELNPWYFVYQPVSYKLNSRQGTRQQLKKMINTCRQKNVRVYADAVVNHMTGSGNDMFPDHRNPAGGSCIHWPNKNGSFNSPWYTHGFQFKNVEFTDRRPSLEYPAVPYDISHFHCERSLSSWNDPFALNFGWLVGLSDLNTENDYVRRRIADYFVELLSIGFSGFRIDAAKHISPSNLAAIFKLFKDKLGGNNLPDDFITYLEVIMGGEKDLLMCQDNLYNYGPSFEKILKQSGLSDSDVYKIKIWESDYPKEHPICGYWAISSERFAIGLDCHDDQNPGSSSRDMGDKGSVLIKEKNVPKHRNFEVHS